MSKHKNRNTHIYWTEQYLSVNYRYCKNTHRLAHTKPTLGNESGLIFYKHIKNYNKYKKNKKNGCNNVKLTVSKNFEQTNKKQDIFMAPQSTPRDVLFFITMPYHTHNTHRNGCMDIKYIGKEPKAYGISKQRRTVHRRIVIIIDS